MSFAPAPIGETGQDPVTGAGSDRLSPYRRFSRDEWASLRADTPLVEWDDAHQMVKLNPIAAWSGDDLFDYVARHDVPVNLLLDEGYPSIGCKPCTRPVAPGEDPRAGRWAGHTKTECGLHVTPGEEGTA